MNAANDHVAYAVVHETMEACYPTDEVRPARKRSSGKLLLVAGLVALVGAASILAAPEISIMTAIGAAVVAGISSASITFLARR